MKSVAFGLMLLLFLLLADKLAAQTVDGIVVDKASGLPLPGATVYFDAQ